MKRIILSVLLRGRILKYLNFKLRLDLHGKTFVIPLLGTTGVEYFLREKETWMQVILKRVNEVTMGKGTFLDVGANIGQTLLKVKCVNNNWEYIGFEPNPNCLQYLYNLIKVNRFSSIRVVPFGLSDRLMIGNLSLFNESPVDSAASVVEGFRSRAIASFAVPLICCDEMTDLFQTRIAVVKIDVEGGELEVLKGMRSIIQRDGPIIICEILPVYGRANARLGRQLELEQMLHDLTYVKFRIHSDGSLSHCAEIGIHDAIENVNYLFCPKATQDVIINNFEVHHDRGQ